MRVGVDTFTLRDLKLDAFQQLELIRSWGLDGAQFGGLRGLSPTLELSPLQEIRKRADELGLYSHVSVSQSCNPHLTDLPRTEHLRQLSAEIAAAAACGWHELHGSLGGGDERYLHPVPWSQQLADSAVLLRQLGPVLRQHGSRIDLETHGDSTTFELVRVVEAVGPDCVGICLDTANVMCHCEDPVLAAKRAAPYTHLTHTKDAVAFFTDHGYRRQTLPPGRGALDWGTILPILAEYSPDLPLSIEDHKWLFDFHCFDRHWLALHPDLTLDEYALFMRLVWRCQQRFTSGELKDADEEEKTPHVAEVEARLRSGAEFLRQTLAGLGLRDRGAPTSPFSLSIMHRG
jgi:sugar phosphate isomerase/epimerase